MLTLLFLQILHVGRVETDWVLGVVDVLAESSEAIGFVCRASMTSSVDDFPCVAEVTATMITAPRWACMVTLVLIFWMLVVRRTWFLVSSLISSWPCGGMAVAGNKRNQVLPLNLVEGLPREALHSMDLRCVL